MARPKPPPHRETGAAIPLQSPSPRAEPRNPETPKFPKTGFLDILLDFSGHFSGGSKMAFFGLSNALLGFRGSVGGTGRLQQYPCRTVPLVVSQTIAAIPPLLYIKMAQRNPQTSLTRGGIADKHKACL